MVLSATNATHLTQFFSYFLTNLKPNKKASYEIVTGFIAIMSVFFYDL
jgi:hypothetical protein